MKIELTPIGIIHSPFRNPAGSPIQPTGAKRVNGSIQIFEEYRTGLRDLEGFSHIYLLYHFHRSTGYNLSVVPFMDTRPRGLFATRAPKRPNPIGLSIVRLDKVEDGRLYIQNVDVLDGTPLLDIKPFAPQFDAQQEVRAGWLEQITSNVAEAKSDERFK